MTGPILLGHNCFCSQHLRPVITMPGHTLERSGNEIANRALLRKCQGLPTLNLQTPGGSLPRLVALSKPGQETLSLLGRLI